MASVPVVLIMNGPDKYSWSERFWYNGPTDDDTLDVNVGALITARCAILTSNCKVIRARCGTVYYRDPYVIIPNNGQGSPGNESPPTVEQEVALLFYLEGTPNGYNRPFLKGIPSRIIDGDSYAPDPQFNENLTTFTATLFNGLWNVRGTNSTATPLVYSMAAITPLSPRGYTFTYTTPVGGTALVVGQTIRVSGTAIPGYSGLKRVTKVTSPTQVTVGGASPPVSDSAPAPYFTTISSFDNPISRAQPDSITTRKSGRPFGLTRGRRQTLYSLRR